MSSFVSTGTTSTTTAEPVTNNGFWPDIKPAEFRDTHRLDGTITAVRIEGALLAAMATVNRTLRDWQARQVEAGYITVDAVPVPIWQAPGVFEALYLRAVYSTAHASLAERYRDYDATASTRDRGDLNEYAGESYRRDAAWAISEIEGRPHSTVELI
ncbi:head completion/stabilization protein [Chromohalobacter canadensis]|uniref:head completion/stabilization protein n=1 Tax=Chromohalobacter canadensis TaxID=141389 RepID=UPI0021BF6B09|nr:head completion/stabilization protein [Chromohalobacter canadensis]MCT8469463.1 head completion/stabilization protein [Chromohalobacter canadensis]MCT8472087.1 head completion/stabilization protein [Chromohalobacter canadensis]MCT8499800.1 head completion/stabilization protein [Chromohalobacter canadensis]